MNIPKNTSRLNLGRFGIVFFFFLFSALSFSFFPTPAHAGILSRPPNNLGLVGYWPFNEGAGSTAHDASGSGNNGTLVNSPTWTTGQIIGALSFNGTSQYVSVPGSFISTPTALTVSAWVNMSPSLNIANGQYIASSRSNTNNGWSAYVFCGGASPHNCGLAFVIQNVAVYNTADDPIPFSKWQHVTVTWNGTNARYYINGVADATVSTTGSMTTGSSLLLGAQANGGVPNFANFFTGSIDDVRIYNRALSAQEVQVL